jgi:hypothetical protein
MDTPLNKDDYLRFKIINFAELIAKFKSNEFV